MPQGEPLPKDAQIGDPIPSNATIGDQAAAGTTPLSVDKGPTGFLPHLGSALLNFVRPAGVSPYPGMDQDVKSQMASDAGAADQERAKAGYSKGYRMAVPFAQAVGVNVPGMEEAARQGDEGGVLGEAVAPLAAYGALRGISKLPGERIAKTVGKLGANVAADTPIIKNITPSKIGQAWQSTAPTQPVTAIEPDVYQRSVGQPRAYPAQTAQPIPPRQGLALPGRVEPTTAYNNVDALRSKLTSPEAQLVRGGAPSAALGEIPVPTGPASLPSVGLGELGQPAGERQAATSFMKSNPSALGRLPKPAGSAGSMAESVEGAPSTSKGVAKGTDIAKVEAPKAKPVEVKSAPARQADYMIEGATEADLGTKAFQSVRIKTYDELANYANQKSLKGRTDWARSDFERSGSEHGKSSNPNARYVRGEMLKEARSKPEALGKK